MRSGVRGFVPVLLLLLALGFAVLSASNAAAQESRPEHPRVLFRGKGGPGCVSIAEMRGQLRKEPWKPRLDSLKKSPHGAALHWLLTDEEASAAAALAEAKKLRVPESFGHDPDWNDLVLCAAYDWLYRWKGFTLEDKKELAARIDTMGRLAQSHLEKPDTRFCDPEASRAFMRVALAAGALDGPRADQLRVFAVEYFEKVLRPGLVALEGAWPSSPGDAICEEFACQSYALWTLRTACGRDFMEFNPRGNAWSGLRARWITLSVLPTLGWVRWNDSGIASLNKSGRNVLDMIAVASQDNPLRWLSAEVGDLDAEGGYPDRQAPDLFIFGFPWKPMLHDSHLWSVFGKKTLGQVLWTSRPGTKYSSSDRTIFTFRAGDRLHPSQHPDQGSFTIWDGGWLAVDSGDSLRGGKNHAGNYARRTVAHNTVIFGTDAEGGQRTPEVPGFRTIEEWEARKNELGLETGDLLEEKHKRGDKVSWIYLSADLTKAYRPEVVEMFTREIMVCDHFAAIVVFDKVRATAKARWLLHSGYKPEIRESGFRIEGKGSFLYANVLLPKEAAIRRIGPGFVVDGADVKPAARLPPAAGGWRVEIEGTDCFLVVLQPVTPGHRTARLSLIEEPDKVGVKVEDQEILFQRKGVSHDVDLR
ncbi:MAG: heparinase II/III family protein [Planctomycetes bacterium]|nr:heparinase II/III family protein [Planctomycetota bacterium]